MDRRNFIKKSAFCLLGSYLGLNLFSKAFGSEAPDGDLASSPKIALIIDDIGYSRSIARQFAILGIPLTFSVLPQLPASQDIAEDIRSNGHEIMLHQPMEPFDSHFDPGPGALYVGYNPGQITRIMERNIAEVPYAVGVNNHMGSKFTACQPDIEKALRVVKQQGLFFVDSRTTTMTCSRKESRELMKTINPYTK